MVIIIVDLNWRSSYTNNVEAHIYADCTIHYDRRS